MTAEKITLIKSVWVALLERVRGGETLRVACAALKVDRTDVWRYRRIDKPAAIELRDALEDNVDSQIDDLDDTIVTTADPRVARVRAEFIWRRAASLNPERYADRQRVDVRAVHLDLNTVMQEAQRRLAVREALRVAHVHQPALADLM